MLDLKTSLRFPFLGVNFLVDSVNLGNYFPVLTRFSVFCQSADSLCKIFCSLELNMDLPSAQQATVGQSTAAASGEQVS